MRRWHGPLEARRSRVAVAEAIIAAARRQLGIDVEGLARARLYCRFGKVLDDCGLLCRTAEFDRLDKAIRDHVRSILMPANGQVTETVIIRNSTITDGIGFCFDPAQAEAVQYGNSFRGAGTINAEKYYGYRLDDNDEEGKTGEQESPPMPDLSRGVTP